ncbi:MAG: glycosyltransferase [Chloroflexi bacterium]|nr:glycosyltransferase [Chloroflexota bacterium]
MAHIVFFARNSKAVFSGGRYHAWMMAEALAEAGHQVSFVTDNRPIFYDDFRAYPAHHRIRLIVSTSFEATIDQVDLVIQVPSLLPQRDNDRRRIFQLYRQSYNTVNTHQARLALLSFETPNWVNALMPGYQDSAANQLHFNLAAEADLILSISGEGDRYAQAEYVNAPSSALFRYCYPAINSRVADAVEAKYDPQRIMVSTRLHQAHKGGDLLDALLIPELAGTTISVLIGRGRTTEAFDRLRGRAYDLGITLEPLILLSDREKFQHLKQSAMLLFLTRFEGYGIPPIEAQYCGVPCVAFDLPVLREVNGDGLVYLPPDDIPTLQSAVVDLLSNPLERAVPPPKVENLARFEAFIERLTPIIDETLSRPARSTSQATRADLPTTDLLIPPAAPFTQQTRIHTILISTILTDKKVAYFERLDRYLARFNYRIVILNSAPLNVETSLAIVHVPRDIFWGPNIELFRQQAPEIGPLPDVYYQAAELEAEVLETDPDRTLAALWEFSRFFRQYLRDEKPRVCILWDPFTGIHRVTRHLCEEVDLPVLFVHEGVMPGSIVFEAGGVMGESWLAQESERTLALPVTEDDLAQARHYLDFARSNQVTRKSQDQAGRITELVRPFKAQSQTIVFYAGQNDYRSGLWPNWLPESELHSPLYRHTLDALQHLSQLAEIHNWQVLFKPHPNLADRYQESPPARLPRVHDVIGANIFECIEQSDVTTTILSQVSYLGLIHRKAVVLLGRNQLSEKGCVYEPGTLAEVGPLIEHAAHEGFTQPMQEAWERHVAQVWRHYVFAYDEDTRALVARDVEEAARFILSHCRLVPQLYHPPAPTQPIYDSPIMRALRYAWRRIKGVIEE